MKGREDNTDDRKRRGQHKRQAQLWTDTDKTRNGTVVAFIASAAKADAEEHLRKFGVLCHSPGIAYSRIKCIE